jgi:hypothetical protein
MAVVAGVLRSVAAIGKIVQGAARRAFLMIFSRFAGPTEE